MFPNEDIRQYVCVLMYMCNSVCMYVCMYVCGLEIGGEGRGRGREGVRVWVGVGGLHCIKNYLKQRHFMYVCTYICNLMRLAEFEETREGGFDSGFVWLCYAGIRAKHMQ